jgi:branched-chain amino acid transport system ATP-binding protein
MNDSGMTIVVVEQNASLALASAHHAVVLETGRIVLAGESSVVQADESMQRSCLGY